MRTYLHATAIWLLLGAAAFSQQLNLDVYANGEIPEDTRLGELKTLKGYFPFDPVPETKQAWLERCNEVRQRILVSAGLWPMPPRPAVSATIHGRVERDNYTVEKVYFESYPGLYVTGSLYRPKESSKPCPVILSPHGHWKNGRFYESDSETVRKQRFNGAEENDIAGRFPLQARCVQLARMGCIVFHYDMLGYADSRPVTYERAHRHSKRRALLENPKAWGLYTAQAEMRLQNIFGLQTFNSLRAVDFVASLPDADPTRIAVTGASGGGTQTMILGAIEPRIAVSFPAVMVSTAMQGGCACENACCLRVGTGNVEFAALFCPKPQGINSANDWTVEFATKGLPELKQLYKLFGAEDNVEGYSLVQFPHNYNHVSRGKMYAWMNKHLGLGFGKWPLEEPFEPLSIEEMSVWNDEHPAPPSGVVPETKLLQAIASASEQQLESLASDSAKHKATVRAALETITATSWQDIQSIERENVSKTDSGDYWMFKDILRSGGCELPVVFLYPKTWNKKVVVWTSSQGKASLLAEGQLRDEVTLLLDAGFAIAAPDLFRQGEFLAKDESPVTQTRKVGDNRDIASYTFGYNRTLLAQRVHDLLVVLRFIAEDDHGPDKISLLAIEGATPFASVASVLAGQNLDQLIFDDDKYRFSRIKSWRDPSFLPGAIKYGDLPGLLRCSNNVKAIDNLLAAISHLTN